MSKVLFDFLYHRGVGKGEIDIQQVRGQWCLSILKGTQQPLHRNNLTQNVNDTKVEETQT